MCWFSHRYCHVLYNLVGPDNRDGNQDLEPLYNKEMNQKTTEYIIIIPHKVLHGRAQTTVVTNHCVEPGSLLLVGSSATQLLSRVKATVK